MWNILPVTAFLGVFMLSFTVGQRRPPNYSQEQMPVTSFNCRDKIIGGYYADPETDCQMFHVCVKVPGLGVQDFKFLCPNDTSFDQENQICDDWYNIDCEQATLYYSDNFDLYRLGSEISKVRPGSVNNAVSDVEDEVYLHQRSDRGENVGRDLLRGSQSGNFFSNRGGRDDDFEDDSGSNKGELFKGGKKKAILQQRKPVNNNNNYQKRPTYNNQQQFTTTTSAPTTIKYQQSRTGYNGHGRFAQRQQVVTTQAPPPSTERQREKTETYNVQQRQRSGGYYQTTSTTAAVGHQYSNYQEPQRVAPTTQRPYYNNQGGQTSTSSPTGNYNYNPQQQTTRGVGSGNNNYQNYNGAPTTLRPTGFDANAYFGRNPSTQNNNNYNNQGGTTYRPNYNLNQQQQTSPSTPPQTAPTTQKPSFYNNFNLPATTTSQRPGQDYNNYNNYNGNNNGGQETGNAPTTASSEFNNYHATQRLYKINLNAAVGGFQNNNNQNQNDDRYDDGGEEFLKTAPSQNLAQSSFNRVLAAAAAAAKNNAAGSKPSQPAGSTRFNATVGAGYRFNAGQSDDGRGVARSQGTRYTPPPPLPPSPTPQPRPFQSQQHQQQHQQEAGQQQQQKKINSKTTTKKDESYDYAYYDDGAAASEYENIENVEEFSRTTARKRST